MTLTQEQQEFIIANSEKMTIRQMVDKIGSDCPKIRLFIYLRGLPYLRQDGKIVKRECKNIIKKGNIFNVNQYDDWITGGPPRRNYTPREIQDYSF